MKFLLAAVALCAALVGPAAAAAVPPAPRPAASPAVDSPRSPLANPAGWAIMLLGMGLAGAAVRRDDDLA